MTQYQSYVRALDGSQSESGVEADLRSAAIAADAAATLEISLALVWRELVHDLCRVVDGFFTDERCYIVLVPSDAARPLQGRRREILEAVLCGSGQKAIALDRGLAPSTIALNARLGLEQLGVSSKASRVHPLLMLAAKAGSRDDGTLAGSLSSITSGDRQLRVIAIPRPDRRLFRVLPPAELAVIRYLIEGARYDEIARARQTSLRTIANQITAVFRRMRVSGRNELIARLFFVEGLERAPHPRCTAPAEHAPSSAPSPVRPALRSA